MLLNMERLYVWIRMNSQALCLSLYFRIRINSPGWIICPDKFLARIQFKSELGHLTVGCEFADFNSLLAAVVLFETIILYSCTEEIAEQLNPISGGIQGKYTIHLSDLIYFVH